MPGQARREQKGRLAQSLESDPAWLADLQDLNQVVAASGVPLMGNLCYQHQAPYLDQPPDPAMAAKRLRFRQALVGRHALLELGVNAGHSAYLALTACPELHFYGVDICQFPYTRPAVSWLQERFPGRVTFFAGNGSKVLPTLSGLGITFDAFHIDGAKWTYYSDLLHAQRLVRGRAARVIVDDASVDIVAATWRRCLAQRVVVADPAFPDMVGARFTNAIGLLLPARQPDHAIHLAEAWLRSRKRTGWLLAKRARRRLRAARRP